MRTPVPPLAAVLAAAIPWLAAGGGDKKQSEKQGEETKLAAEVQWFAGRSGDVQKKILESIRKSLSSIDDPWLRSVEEFAARAAAVKKKDVETKTKISPEGAQALSKELPFPVFKEYVFGARTIRPAVDADGKPKDAPGTKGAAADEIRALLSGHAPGLDLAFAECLSELDHDKSADPFALFLESWRNGEESFYRALDRTAGTKGEVFYYDAMLGEFSSKFMGGALGDKKFGPSKSALQTAHDALHNGFLTYRQYRALREAFALSLLLGRETKLPAVLERYETAPTGKYSVRDDVEMLLALSGGAMAPAIQALTSTAKPLPAPLWSAQYEPVQPFYDAFTKKLDEINAKFGSPAAALAKYRERRSQLSKEIAERARAALADAGCAAAKAPH